MTDRETITIAEAAVQHGGHVYTGKRHGIIMQKIWAEELAAGKER